MPLTRKRGKYWYGFVRVNSVSSAEQSTGCEDRVAAEKVLDGWGRDLADPDSAAKREATLDDALSAMLDQCKELVAARPPKLKQPTLDSYDQKARVVKTVFLALEPSVTHLAQIDPAALERYISARRALGTHEHTISKELTVLRMALRLARSRKQYDLHWDDLLPAGFSAGYEPDQTFLMPDVLNLLLGELLPDHAARTAFMVATSCEWSASVRAERADITELDVHIRGSKRETRDRRVPLVMPWQRDLVAYAAEHGQGKDGNLFVGGEATTFNHALYRACDTLNEQLKAAHALGVFFAWIRDGHPEKPKTLPRVSANDLRRTFGMWMRAAGVAVSEVALMMGHRDSRMAERVYARLPPDLLRQLVQSVVCQPAAGSNPAEMAEVADMADARARKSAKLAPRAGFEPATHGLTVRGSNWARPRYDRLCRQTARALPAGCRVKNSRVGALTEGA